MDMIPETLKDNLNHPGKSDEIVNCKQDYMNRNLQYMPADEIRLCDAKGDCIEARGRNAQNIAVGIVILLISISAYYLFKKK